MSNRERMGPARIATVLLVLILVASPSPASLWLEHVGEEFMVGFLPTAQPNPEPVIHLLSYEADSILVEWPAGSPVFSQVVALGPGSTATVTLPAETASNWMPGIGQNAVHIKSITDVFTWKAFACYLANTDDSTAGAALALPYLVLRHEYVVTNFTAPDVGFADAGQFLVIATSSNTQVRITPTQDLASGQPAGVEFIVNLEYGEAFYGLSAAVSGSEVDLTGTHIIASPPVAVMNGNRCAVIPGNATKCGHLFEMAVPVRFWGDSVLAANPPERDSGSFFTIVSADDNNAVTVHGVTAIVLQALESTTLGPLAGDFLITGTGDLQVTQFTTSSDAPGVSAGGTEMNHLRPVIKWRFANRFLAGVGPGSTGATVSMYVHSDDVGLATLDGVAVDSSEYTPIGTSNYHVAHIDVLPGPHVSIAPSGAFDATVVHEYDASGRTYAYPAGFYYAEGSCLIVVAGDVNASGSVTSADIIYLVGFVFKGGSIPEPCEANGDVNCDAFVTSADIIYLVNFIFKGQGAPCDICQDSEAPC